MGRKRHVLDTFLRSFPYTGKLTTCYGLVGDTVNYLDMSRLFAVSITSPQQVCRVIVMEYAKRQYNRLLPMPICYGLVQICYGKAWGNWCNGFGKTCYAEVANLLSTCYRETGVMDFDLYLAAHRYSISSHSYLSILTEQAEIVHILYEVARWDWPQGTISSLWK